MTTTEHEQEEIAARLYNARHGMADGARGGNLAARGRDGGLVHAGGANWDDEPPRETVEDSAPGEKIQEGDPTGAGFVEYPVPAAQSTGAPRDIETGASGKDRADPVTPEQSAAPRAKTKSRRQRARETVWQTLRHRPRLRIATAAGALALYADARRHGSLGGGSAVAKARAAPNDLGRRPPLVGDPVPRQLAELLEEQPDFARWRSRDISSDEFASVLAPLFPRTFLRPWEGLCEREREEMARDLEREAADGDKEARDGGRLLFGMRRQEASGG